MQSPASPIAATDRNGRYADTVVGIGTGGPRHEPNPADSIDAAPEVAPGAYQIQVRLHPSGSQSSREVALGAGEMTRTTTGLTLPVGGARSPAGPRPTYASYHGHSGQRERPPSLPCASSAHGSDSALLRALRMSRHGIC